MDKSLLFYQQDEQGVQCSLCPHRCRIGENHFGKCQVRTVKDNIPVAINYGEITSAAIDPIEKKPLYHYKPGSNILSVGSFGCNMTCQFCQNYTISQQRSRSRYNSIDNLIKSISTIENNIGIAFTYNEPMMWYEYVLEASKALKEYNQGISVVLVTNGYVNKEPLEKLLPYIDAMNIDLKGYTNKFYGGICGASLEPVLETIRCSSEQCHVEVTTLMVTEENDSVEEVGEIASFIASVNKDIPLHLSRYFPRYNMDTMATDIEQMVDGWEEAKKHLNYVYLGNVQGVENNTYCPHCQTQLIKRNGYQSQLIVTKERCPGCDREAKIVI